MELFLGTFEYLLDEKNRVKIPSKFLSLLQENEVIITLMDEHEISLNKKDYFNKQIKKMIEGNSNSKIKQRELIRIITSRSQEIKIDSKGRIVLNDDALKHCSIKKEAVVIGYGDHIAIKSKENHKKYISDLEKKNSIKEGIEAFDELFLT